MGKYSEKQNKWTQAYIRKAYDQIVVRVEKGKRERYKEAVSRKNMSLNEYIVKKLDDLL